MTKIHGWMGVICAGLVASAIGIGCDSGDDGDEGNSAPITQAEFDQIQNGMSYDEVAAILFPANIESDETGGSRRFVRWGDAPSGTTVSVTFEYGVVILKSQIGGVQ